MAFYDLDKKERANVVEVITRDIRSALSSDNQSVILSYYADRDTYIRKAAYLATGRIFGDLCEIVLCALDNLVTHPDFKVRQTAVNAAGEIGKHSFQLVQHVFDQCLFDSHPAVRNAVIGSVKKMGEVNPLPVLAWAESYLLHPDKEVRREICHGIELRGRKHPQDILPLLKQLQFDGTKRVKNTLVHVLGQIAYKKGCLGVVIQDLESWENKQLVNQALSEIVDVHHRYRNFSHLTQAQAIDEIVARFGKQWIPAGSFKDT